jgi:hypothetical protein
MTMEQLERTELQKLRDKFVEIARVLFDQLPDSKERQRQFESKLKFFFKGEPDIRASALRTIEASAIQDREKYLQETLHAIEPLLRFKAEQPDAYDALRYPLQHADYDYELLTDFLGYEFSSNGWIVLHVPENKGKSPMELIAGFRASMKALATFLKQHPNVPGVLGTSWIVADKHGAKVLERMGFTIDGPIDEELRLEYFADEIRPVAKTHMTREEVIAKYG